MLVENLKFSPTTERLLLQFWSEEFAITRVVTTRWHTWILFLDRGRSRLLSLAEYISMQFPILLPYVV